MYELKSSRLCSHPLPFLGATITLLFATTSEPTLAEQVSCDRLIQSEAKFTVEHTFQGDGSYYEHNLVITDVRGGTWAGISSTNNDADENVVGTISGSTFTMYKPRGEQIWRGKCRSEGISGILKKYNSYSGSGRFRFILD